MSAISKYFKMYEIGKSSIAERQGINNSPPQWVIDNATELATHVLDPIREKFGALSPQSWYRGAELEKFITWDSGFRRWCAKHNKPWLKRENLHKIPLQHHGVDNSWGEYFQRKSHPRGEAADIEIVGVSNDELYFWIRDNLSYDQLIREFPKPNDPKSGWVHVSWRGVQANRQSYFSIPWYDKYA